MISNFQSRWICVPPPLAQRITNVRHNKNERFCFVSHHFTKPEARQDILMRTRSRCKCQSTAGLPRHYHQLRLKKRMKTYKNSLLNRQKRGLYFVLALGQYSIAEFFRSFVVVNFNVFPVEKQRSWDEWCPCIYL